MNCLGTASGSPPSLHVIYINTSLETKAYAQELVPTITCTSSKAVQSILQAFAQIPDLNIRGCQYCKIVPANDCDD